MEKAEKTAFPRAGSVDYAGMYRRVSEYLNNDVHSEVNMGARIIDGGLLTDHGPEHIRTVIQRASELVFTKSCRLSPYEIYILLMAIHFHDVGNIKGREDHEIKSGEIYKELGRLASIDATERHYIVNIAQAHGGRQKDKLELLEKTFGKAPKLLGFTVRVPLLASILKLADELADEYTRATKIDWAVVPKESQVFHKFAYALKTVDINHETHTVELDFWLDKENATTKYGKLDSEIFLVDEIKERTYKTHLERLYCMRFMADEIRLNSVVVKINFLEPDSIDPFHDPIGYRLEEKGYPGHDIAGSAPDPYTEFARLCPDTPFSGESIRDEVIALDGDL
ncbi:MAG: hypothetical protein AB7H97_14675 [Pseudobdellovibrionaceae bacterium]